MLSGIVDRTGTIDNNTNYFTFLISLKIYNSFNVFIIFLSSCYDTRDDSVIYFVVDLYKSNVRDVYLIAPMSIPRPLETWLMSHTDHYQPDAWHASCIKAPNDKISCWALFVHVTSLEYLLPVVLKCQGCLFLLQKVDIRFIWSANLHT